MGNFRSFPGEIAENSMEKGFLGGFYHKNLEILEILLVFYGFYGDFLKIQIFSKKIPQKLNFYVEIPNFNWKSEVFAEIFANFALKTGPILKFLSENREIWVFNSVVRFF